MGVHIERVLAQVRAVPALCLHSRFPTPLMVAAGCFSYNNHMLHFAARHSPSPELGGHLLACRAGKSLTAPLDRVKLLLQTRGGLGQSAVAQAARRGGVLDALVAIGREEGLRGYWKGNLPQARPGQPAGCCKVCVLAAIGREEGLRGYWKGNLPQARPGQPAGCCKVCVLAAIGREEGLRGYWKGNLPQARPGQPAGCCKVCVLAAIGREEGLRGYWKGNLPQARPGQPAGCCKVCVLAAIGREEGLRGYWKGNLPQARPGQPAGCCKVCVLAAIGREEGLRGYWKGNLPQARPGSLRVAAKCVCWRPSGARRAYAATGRATCRRRAPAALRG